jgi:hypothetical protein
VVIGLGALYETGFDEYLVQLDAELAIMPGLLAVVRLAEVHANATVLFETVEPIGHAWRVYEGVDFRHLGERWNEWYRERARALLDSLTADEAAILLEGVRGCGHVALKAPDDPGWCVLCLEAMEGEREESET